MSTRPADTGPRRPPGTVDVPAGNGGTHVTRPGGLHPSSIAASVRDVDSGSDVAPPVWGSGTDEPEHAVTVRTGPPGAAPARQPAPFPPEPAAAETGDGPVARPEDRIGRRLGEYLVIRVLGKGGMGVVYEAEDSLIRRRVAVKLLPESVSDDPRSLARFLKEAQSLGRVNHPNTVAIYQVGRHAGGYFLVMELAKAGSAADFLRTRGPFPWAEATRVTADAARGLAAVHEAGLLHRDIKPANIMRAADGTVKLADFGLAKAVVGTNPGRADTVDGLTGDSGIVGTPLFMSPEQCRGEDLDARSDVYSLAATYYALLTGRAPFVAPATMQIMMAHCAAPIPDPRVLVPHVPEACAAVIVRGMAKSPDDRYQSARELQAELDAVLAGTSARPDVDSEWAALAEAVAGSRTGSTRGSGGHGSLATQPVATPSAPIGGAAPASRIMRVSGTGTVTGTGQRPAKSSGSMLPAAAAGFAAAAVLVVGALLVFGGGGGRPSDRNKDQPKDGPPDSRSRRDDDPHNPGARDLTHGDPPVPLPADTLQPPPKSDPQPDPKTGTTPPTNPDPKPAPKTGPDSVDPTAPKTDPNADPKIKAKSVIDPKAPDHRPAHSDYPVGTVLSDTGLGRIRVRHAFQEKAGIAIPSVSISRDGKVAAGARVDRYSNFITFQYRAEGHLGLVGRHQFFNRSVDVAPDGRWWATAAGDVRLMDMKTLRGGTLAGFAGTAAGVSCDLRDDGTLLAVACLDNNVRIVSTADTSKVRVLAGHKGIVEAVAWRPDGRVLAGGSADLTVRLWDIERPDEPAVELRGATANIFCLAWSPDGTKLAAGCGNGRALLWTDLTKPPVELPHVELMVWSAAFTPDGRFLLTGCAGAEPVGKGAELRVWSAADGKALGRLPGAWSGVVSGDGRTLLTGHADGCMLFWDMPAPAGGTGR